MEEEEEEEEEEGETIIRMIADEKPLLIADVPCSSAYSTVLAPPPQWRRLRDRKLKSDV